MTGPRQRTAAAGACTGGTDRAADLGGLLRSGTTTSAQSQNDPPTDGSLVVVVDAQFDGTVDTVRTATADRLGTAAYLTTPPVGQEGGLDPQVRCGLGGHGTNGTAWLSTASNGAVYLSAVIGLAS